MVKLTPKDIEVGFSLYKRYLVDPESWWHAENWNKWLEENGEAIFEELTWLQEGLTAVRKKKVSK